MNSPKLIVSFLDGIPKINDRSIVEVLANQETKMSGRRDWVERAFQEIVKGFGVSTVFQSMHADGLEPVRQLLVISAITGWSLMEARQIFDGEEIHLEFGQSM